MTEQSQSASPATVAAPALSPSSPAIPTANADGTPLTARQQFDALRQNAEWSAAAMKPGTVARQQLDDLNQRMASDVAAADTNPLLAVDPAKDASEYRLPIDVSDADTQGYDKTARSWLHAAGAPASIGTSIANQISQVADRLRGADETALTMHDQKNRQALEKVYGGAEALDAKIDLVGQFLEEVVEVKAPGILDFMEDNPHIFRDSLVLHQLIGLAEVHAARAASK